MTAARQLRPRDPGKWYTPQEIADMLRVSKSAVYRLTSSGDLASYRIGRSVRITAADLSDYLNRARA